MKRLVYLGPEGTFTHQAARALVPDGVELSPLNSLEQVLGALVEGQADYAVAAETSAAGPIADTADALASGKVEALSRHPIRVSFDLYRRPGDKSALQRVYGHEKALAQIDAFITEHKLETRSVASNTAGLAAVRDSDAPGWGAAGPPGLSQHYALEVTARGLEGPASHETVFVLLRRAS